MSLWDGEFETDAWKEFIAMTVFLALCGLGLAAVGVALLMANW